MAEGMLSDEQIDTLLKEAEERLRAQASQLTRAQSDEDEISLEADVIKAKARKPIPRLQHALPRSTYLKDNQGVTEINTKTCVDQQQIALAERLRAVGRPSKSKKINDRVSAGPDWFEMPKTNLTPQLKRDLQLIELRSVLDPHRHYKKNNRKGKIPTFSQTGTVIEGPTEFYSSRVNKRDRAKNFVEEAMVTEKETGRLKRKYTEIQEAQTSGKKLHYKKLLAKRRKRP